MLERLKKEIRKRRGEPAPGDRFKRGRYIVEVVKIDPVFVTIRPVRMREQLLEQHPMVITRMRFDHLYLKGWI